jgi:hypothetical protein
LRLGREEDPRPAEPVSAPAEPVAAVEPVATPESEPGPEASPPARDTPPLLVGGRWSLSALNNRVVIYAARFPDYEIEWKAYLLELEPHADRDGLLPAHFDALLSEVFGGLRDTDAAER